VDIDTAIGGHNGHFPSTQVSLLDAAASGLSGDALERIIAIYWKPVYRFIRLKFRKDNEEAKDLTQGFFTSALERDFFTRFDPAKASFRTYLRMAVERFAANQHAAANRQKRGGDAQIEPLAGQAIATESPEEIFDREWRRQLFALAIEDLRAHCGANGHHLRFLVFEAYDLAADERPSYSEIAACHGIPETSVTNHIAWARRKLRTFVTERLRGATSGARELREEARRLWS
jgi:RNA polymerase sigma factor (sigma-70 family)